MDPLLRRLFLLEIAQQCRLILRAERDLGEALASLDPRDMESTSTAVWLAIQGILVSAANISKILWGSGGKLAAERKELRGLLGVTDSSWLRSTDLQDDFEHFDERLETWFHERGGGEGFPGRSIGEAPDRATQYGIFEPNPRVVTFVGHSTPIPRLVAEVRTILPLAWEAAQYPRDPSA